MIILGSGPNRIGQGIEFDYCCVHAAFELSAAGYETVMVNCNPETVSTDYDTSDRLFFEPLTPEDVLNVCDATLGSNLRGVIVSLGGPDAPQAGPRPAGGRRARPRHQPRLHRPGRGPGAVQRPVRAARDPPAPGRRGHRGRGGAWRWPTGSSYPVLVRPSYVLGGRAMEIVYDEAGLRGGHGRPGRLRRGRAGGGLSATRPVLIDRFLEDATEVDVDAVRDTTGEVLIGGVMEHIEEAGVHSGDSACAIPPPTLPGDVVAVIEDHTRALADALGVLGVINVQYAVKDGTVYILEANPRASRTVPFVSKATAVPLAKVAARLMVGATLAELRAEGLIPANAGADGGGHVAVKEAALPFDRFGVDTLLGPEMRSTGEVMGIDRTFGLAFAKSQTAVGNKLPDRGSVFLSLADRDKAAGLVAARRFADLGFTLVATAGTAAACEAEGIPVGAVVAKLGPEARGDPEVVGVDAVDLIASGKVNLVVNTPRGRGPRADGAHIRLAASAHGVPCLTTVAAALAAAAGIAEWRTAEPRVRSLQEYHRDAQLRLPL